MFLAVVLDLVGDGGRILLDEFSDCLKRHVFAEAVLNLPTILRGKVFVFLLVEFFSHDSGLLSGNLFSRLNSTTNGVSR